MKKGGREYKNTHILAVFRGDLDVVRHSEAHAPHPVLHKGHVGEVERGVDAQDRNLVVQLGLGVLANRSVPESE